MPAPDPLMSFSGPATTTSCPAPAKAAASTAMPGARTPSSLVTRRRIASTLPFPHGKPGGDHSGDDGKHEHQADQGEGSPPGPGLRRRERLLGVDEDLDRQRRVGPEQAAVEALDAADGEPQ